MPLNRREFLATPALAAAQSPTPAAPLDRADLVYERPADRSEAGIPLGNGRMGSLVWTAPASLHLQVNRVDVYANDGTTSSFFERHTDYCGGCGAVEIDCGGAGDDVFPVSGFRQHLSVANALLNIEGRDVQVRALAWHAADVMALEIDDRRAVPQPITVALRMLRYAGKPAVQTRSHTALSSFIINRNRIALVQEFREGAFLCRTAVAIAIAGRDVQARQGGPSELRLHAPAAAGRCTVYIASAASFSPVDDVAARAFLQLDAAGPRGFVSLATDNSSWWRDFWSRGYIELESADGVAQEVAAHYAYYLYLMGSTSRGSYPPKFNGLIFNTGGDQRTWGAQHWFANLSCYYEALPATNRLELLEPVYGMYFAMYDAAARAARQQWGSEGIYIPETVWFNGLEALPDDIAAEMRDVYLLRKPWDQRSQRFREYSTHRHPHSSRWNFWERGSWVDGKWVPVDRGAGPYGPVNHNFGTNAKVAYFFWRRYEYTLDRDFLSTHAYPLLRGAAEFYRHFPNFRKGDDGRYHIHQANSNESVWGARDTDEDLASLHGMLPAAIRAAEILGLDEPLRNAWREILEHLPPLPTSDDPEALKPADYRGPRVFVRGLKPAIKSMGLLPDANSLPMWWFDLCSVESRDAETLATARRTFDAYFRNGISEKTPVNLLSKLAIAASALGRADAVRHLIPSQIRTGNALANRMGLREGPQALDFERLGRAAEALNLAMLQSSPPAPGEAPVLNLFPACPREWSARFQLLARGAFLVRSAIREGAVQDVEIESRAGARCRLRNPWGESEITLYRDGRADERLRGSLVEFGTRPGERISIKRS